MPNSYDPSLVATTPAFQVRLRIGDTNTADYVFDDAEIDFWLASAGGNVVRAAHSALGAIIRSRALLAQVTKLGGYRTEEFAMADLLKLLDQLESELAGGITTGQIKTSSEHLDSYAPRWLDLDGTRVPGDEL